MAVYKTQYHDDERQRRQVLLYRLLLIVDSLICIISLGYLQADYAPHYLFSLEDE